IHCAGTISAAGGRALPRRHHLAGFVRPFRASRRRRLDAGAHRHPAGAAERLMTFPARIHRYSSTPAVDAATSITSIPNPERAKAGKEAIENRTPANKPDQSALGTTDVGAPASRWGVRRRLMVVLVAAAGAGGAAWWFAHRSGVPAGLVLHGNVDLRQVALA